MLEPRLILLDEPFAGVHPRLLEQIIDHIKALNQRGLTIMIVDHNLDAIRSVVRRTAVMARGVKIADGAAEDVLRDPAVVYAYTGSRKDREDRAHG
jgi:branched-chain amino acid transport system ATP-binding protein